LDAQNYLLFYEKQSKERRKIKRGNSIFEVMKRSGRNKTETKLVKRRPFLRSVSDLSEIAIKLKNNVSSALVSKIIV
jgi:hypothetical protein